jgi:hypothetical protein
MVNRQARYLPGAEIRLFQTLIPEPVLPLNQQEIQANGGVQQKAGRSNQRPAAM